MFGLSDLVDVLTLEALAVSVLFDITQNVLVDDLVKGVDDVVIVVDDVVVTLEVVLGSTVSSSELESYLSFFRIFVRNLANGSLRFITMRSKRKKYLQIELNQIQFITEVILKNVFSRNIQILKKWTLTLLTVISI